MSLAKIKINKKYFVLLHGAWHGNWCWKYVTPLLTQQGHEVIAPNLPGHENSINFKNNYFKNINLNTYVNFVINIIKSQKKPVILVGHSMAGVVISEVAEQIPDVIEKLVYISAFIPSNKSSLLLEARKSRFSALATETLINENTGEIIIKNKENMRELFYHCCHKTDANEAINLLQSQEPFIPFVNRVKFSKKFETVKKLYIECMYDKIIKIEDQRRMQTHITGDVMSLYADHAPFFSMPEKLVAKLIT